MTCLAKDDSLWGAICSSIFSAARAGKINDFRYDRAAVEKSRMGDVALNGFRVGQKSRII